MTLVYITSNRLVFAKTGDPFQGAYFTWGYNLGAF